ncbi:MAG: hypothetical protein U1E56_04115 [Bauldia sp.]
MNAAVTSQFLETKRAALAARSQRLAELTPRRVGLRPQDIPYSPMRPVQTEVRPLDARNAA